MIKTVQDLIQILQQYPDNLPLYTPCTGNLSPVARLDYQILRDSSGIPFLVLHHECADFGDDRDDLPSTKNITDDDRNYLLNRKILEDRVKGARALDIPLGDG